MENTQISTQKEEKKGFTGLQVFWIVVGAVVLTTGITLFIAWTFLFPKPFEPVVLNAGEKRVLETKLEQLESAGMVAMPQAEAQKPTPEPEEDFAEDGSLIPRKYSEEASTREVEFTEREINAMIASNTELADKLAVDLSDNLVSARMRVPMDPDFPFLGGKVLRVKAGVEMAYREGRPVVILKGVSLMGVPMPNAWIGGVKNIDLVKEFSGEEGFWKAFGDGVESVAVEEGKFKVSLKE